MLGKAVEIVKERNTKLWDISPPRFVHKPRDTKRYGISPSSANRSS
jgi:hypothetical protein